MNYVEHEHAYVADNPLRFFRLQNLIQYLP